MQEIKIKKLKEMKQFSAKEFAVQPSTSFSFNDDLSIY